MKKMGSNKENEIKNNVWRFYMYEKGKTFYQIFFEKIKNDSDDDFINKVDKIFLQYLETVDGVEEAWVSGVIEFIEEKTLFEAKDFFHLKGFSKGVEVSFTSSSWIEMVEKDKKFVSEYKHMFANTEQIKYQRNIGEASV